MRRIFPALFVVIALTTLAALVIMLPRDLDAYAKSAIAATASLANVWFFTQEGYFTEAAELKPLLHTWSLGVEEQFYLLFPPFAYLAYRWQSIRGVFVACVLGALVSFGFSIWGVAQNPDAAFYLPQYRAWELMIGAVLAVVLSQGWLAGFATRTIPAFVIGMLGIVAIGWSTLFYGPETRFPGPSAVVPCLGAAALILSGHLAANPASRLLGAAPFVFIGKISYSWYLWHWPIIAFVYYTGTGDLGTTEGVACVVISFALSYGSWRFVEQPFRDRQRVSRNSIFALSVLCAAVIFGATGMIAKLNGLPSRLSDEILSLTQTDGLLHGRRDCHFVTPTRAETGDVCLRGETSAPASFILVGDSHADAISPAIFAAAVDMGLAGYQYTNAGFRPLSGVVKRGEPGWEQQTEAFIAFAEDRSDIQTLFVTAMWAHQMTGYSYRHEGDMWQDDSYDGSGSAYNVQATIGGLRRLAERLPGRRIVLLDDVPSGTGLDLSTQIRLVRFGHMDAAGLSRREADSQRLTYVPHLTELAAENSAIEFFPFFENLCGAELCPLFDEEVILYRNGDHLSLDGALRHIGRAQILLRTFIPPQQ